MNRKLLSGAIISYRRKGKFSAELAEVKDQANKLFCYHRPKPSFLSTSHLKWEQLAFMCSNLVHIYFFVSRTFFLNDLTFLSILKDQNDTAIA